MRARSAWIGLALRLRQGFAFAALPLVACAQASSQSATTTSGGGAPANVAASPRLIVAITVDQMRYDYLERFASQYQSGLARLVKGGASYTNAYQDHANTETAPGHATILSGREPYRTGIVLNAIGVPDANAPLIGGGGPGASPFRFRGTALIDWMKAKDRRSRALSVSRKDRGAILPIGRAKESVFWYASNGNFTTSTYYSDTLPTWVKRFNARRIPQQYAGKAWEPLLPVSSYPEPDTVSVEDLGREPAFPHRLSDDTARAVRDFIGFPWMDDLTVAFALDGVNAMKLGNGPAPDLLAVSLSTTDAVGHRFGMASRELHDQMLRLDRAIGTLIDSLYKLRDSSTIVFALTADHAVTLPPELAKAEAGQPPPMRVDLSDVAKTFRVAIAGRGADSNAFDFEDAMLFVDKESLEKKGIKLDSLARAFADAAKREPGVYRADVFQTILKADTTDPIVRRWRHAVPPDYPVLVVVTLNHGSVWGSYTTGIHGSPWDDDGHVPLVLYGPSIAPGRHDEFTGVTSLGPTLARLLGASPSEPIDGHVLTSAIR
jgi:predicted AlkP superfamily pyrophosphatase or phosphodiesterase